MAITQLAGAALSVPVNTSSSSFGPSPIAGSVLPISRAEELLATLPGVISVRIVAGPNGAVDEIHLLTTDEVAPKATVRNVESALMAQLGMRVSHKKISVAATRDTARRPTEETPASRRWRRQCRWRFQKQGVGGCISTISRSGGRGAPA